MSYETVIFERDGDIGIIRFNRPKALNAINVEMVNELNGVLDEVEQDGTLRVLVLTGEGGKAFVAGADILHMVNLDSLGARRFSREGHRLLNRLESLAIPVIASVNGFALGGGTEIAMACDFIYASEGAKFGQPEINLGIIPGFGGTQRLSRLVGKNLAKELCMTGVMISALEAKQIGLVNKVFSADKLWEETMKTAQLLCTKGRVSIRAVKRCIDRGFDTDLANGCYIESEGFAVSFASEDAREGMSAFLEKRKPQFKGELG